MQINHHVFAPLLILAVACGGGKGDQVAAPEDPAAALLAFHKAVEDSLTVRSARRVAVENLGKDESEIRDKMEFCAADGWSDEAEKKAFDRQIAAIRKIESAELAKPVEYAEKMWELANDLVEKHQALCAAVKRGDGAVEALSVLMAGANDEYSDVEFELRYAVEEAAPAAKEEAP